MYSANVFHQMLCCSVYNSRSIFFACLSTICSGQWACNLHCSSKSHCFGSKMTAPLLYSAKFSREAEFLDVIGTKEFSSLLFTVTVTSTIGFYPPPPLGGQKCFETGFLCKHCTVYSVHGTSSLRTLKIMPGNLNEIER